MDRQQPEVLMVAGSQVERLRLLEAALAASADGVIIVDTAGRNVFMNEAGRRLAQGERSPDLPVEQQAAQFELRYPDGRPIPPEETPVGRALRGETVTDFLVVLGKPDGSAVSIGNTASPVRDEQGKLVGAVSIFRDLGEKQSAEAERERLLREAEHQRQLFQAVVEGAPAAIAVVAGPDFIYQFVNPAYQAFAPGKPMLGRPYADVWPEMAGRVLPTYRTVLRSGETYHATDRPFRIRRMPDGPLEDAYFTFTYVPLHVVEGQTDVLLVLAVETTEHVEACKRIEELSEVAQRRAAELQSVLDNMVDGVFVCDLAGRLTLVNEAGVRLYGLASSEEVKQAAAEFPDYLGVRRPDGRPYAREEQPLARALAGETIVLEDQIVYDRRTGRDVYVRVSAAPIRDRSGAIVGGVAVGKDVTELTELDRLKDQFIAVAAHELKTPVAIMKGYAQVLLRTAGEISPQHRKMLDAIDRGADRIDRIVRDLLDISRLHQGRLELALDRIDLPEFVEEIVDRMALMAAKHRIRLVSAQPVVVQGDRDRLDQVLVNLIDNAVRYSPQGGDVEVDVAVPGGRAVVSVRDGGVGIPREKQGGMFQRFYRAHTDTPCDYGGMGVGLYIAREILSRHGGRIWFESEEGEGSTFSFDLPLRGERAGT